MSSEGSLTDGAESAYREEPDVQVAPAAAQKAPVTDYLATGTRERDGIAERAEEDASELVKARMIPPQGNDAMTHDSTLATA